MRRFPPANLVFHHSRVIRALSTFKIPEYVMAFRKASMTRKDFQNRVEGFLIGAMGWHCMAEIAAANGYPDHIQHWREDVERIIFIDLSFFISTVTTKTAFNKRRAINELIAECNSPEVLQASVLIARKTLAARYLKRPYADLKLPDIESCRSTFWRMVSGTVELSLEK
jgi:hypothetical protein